MRTLTIRQPWASLIATNQKTTENRTWKPPSVLQSGDLLAVHAANLRDTSTRWHIHGVPPTGLPTSAVIAVARFQGAHEATHDCCPTWGWPDCWHWQLADAVALPQPVTATGRLGVWTLPADVHDAVMIQLGEACWAVDEDVTVDTGGIA